MSPSSNNSDGLPPSNSYTVSSDRLSQAPIVYGHANSNRGPRPSYYRPMSNNWPMYHGRPHGPHPQRGWVPQDYINFNQQCYNIPWAVYPGIDPLTPPTAPSVRFAPPRHDFLSDRILKQVDYYFSEENLVKDLYLRQNMDDCGWVSVSLIACFPRMKQMETEVPVILASLRRSNVVELEGNKVRRRNEWRKWLLPRPL